MGEPSSGFNHAYLCCLPKKSSRIDPVHGAIYTPSQTRPLSIVNTDNRIIANAFRFLLEPILNKWISESQRGFLPGRSMIANIMDIEQESMVTSLNHDRGATILFDFEAAFPSIAQSICGQFCRT